MLIKNKQLHSVVLNQRDMLIKDIEAHLQTYCPDIIANFPDEFFHWAINDSIEIASQFNIDDVFSMRLFVRLRWEISPGFYKQPDIAKVLSQTYRSAEERFNEITSDRYAEAWENAENFHQVDEWHLDDWNGL